MLQFGSRAGTWAGLGVLTAIVAVIAWAVARLSGRGRIAAGVGIGLFIALIALVYASTFSGFYEAEIRSHEVALHYLIDPRIRSIPSDSIREVRPYFAYKLRWRMDIETVSGERYTSASGSRDAINAAADRLREAVIRGRRGG